MTDTGESVTKKLLRRLGSRDVWSFNFILFAAPFYALASLAFDAFRVNNFSIQWVLIGLVTFAEIVLLAAIARLVIPKRAWEAKAAPLINIALAAVIGAIKNITVAWLAILVGLEQEIDWWLRGIGGAILLGCLILAFVMFSGSRLEHQSTIEELQRVRRELVALRKNADSEVETQINELIFDTKKALEPKIAQIESLLANAGSTESIVEQLRDLVRNHIRPYSHELQTQISNLDQAPTVSVNLKPKKTKRTLWPDRFLLHDAMIPFWSGLYVSVAYVSVVYGLYGSSQIHKAALPSVSFMLLISVVYAAAPKGKKLSKNKAIFTLVSIAVASAVISTLTLNLALSLEGYFGLILISYATMSTIVALGMGLIGLLDKERVSLEKRALQVNQELELELKLFEQALWLNRKRWSYALHGTVQATLTAAITRLTQLGRIDAGVIELVKKDLDHVRETISTPAAKRVDLWQEFRDIGQTWRGICNVTFDVADAASKMLAGSSSTSMCVNEIVKEAVSNARRHGSAQNVLVRIQKGSNDLIHLKITNDGEPAAYADSKTPKDELGLGLKMYDELSLRWRIKSDRVSRKTLLEMDLPVIAD